MDSTGAALSLIDCFTSTSTAGTALSSDGIDYTDLVKNKPYNLVTLIENNLRKCFFCVYIPFCVVESSADSVGLSLLEVESAWCDSGKSSGTAGAADSSTTSNINAVFYIPCNKKCLYSYYIIRY